ncbi:hypothetical protein LTR66_016501 [Elasticomyces elasticus]|nr:hypothetical protein LTR66_016501 [Elasticomyces elasticus]
MPTTTETPTTFNTLPAELQVLARDFIQTDEDNATTQHLMTDVQELYPYPARRAEKVTIDVLPVATSRYLDPPGFFLEQVMEICPNMQQLVLRNGVRTLVKEPNDYGRALFEDFGNSLSYRIRAEDIHSTPKAVICDYFGCGHIEAFDDDHTRDQVQEEGLERGLDAILELIIEREVEHTPESEAACWLPYLRLSAHMSAQTTVDAAKRDEELERPQTNDDYRQSILTDVVVQHL